MIHSSLYHLAIVFVSGLVIAISSIYLYFQKQYKYWSDRKIPHKKPTFPLGNLDGNPNKAFVLVFKDLYDYGKNEKIFGIYQAHRPVLMIHDPNLIKRCLIGDFMSFHDREIYFNEKDDPLSAHLFTYEGSAWKNLRAKLSPTFTSGKMKMMFPLIADCGTELVDVLKSSAEKEEVIEVKEISAKYTTDVIASCAFGVQANSLKNPDAIFRKMGKKLAKPNWSFTIKNIMAFLLPDLAKLLKVVTTPKDVSDFFMGSFREMVEYRENNNVTRNDFLQLLIQLKNKGYLEDVDSRDKGNVAEREPFSLEAAAAQAFVFFAAGFETSSTLMQFILYELALNPKVQSKLREEIKETIAKCNGKLTYEGAHEMEYLGRVIDETLRKYPPAPLLLRTCTKDYKFPDLDFTLEKGMTVMIPIGGIQMDERYFPDPEKFDPDRFTAEAKSSRHSFTYLPFGEGPRLCIGQRFAFMQTRVGIINMLLNYEFHVCPKRTPIPIELDPKALSLTPKGGMNLKITSVK